MPPFSRVGTSVASTGTYFAFVVGRQQALDHGRLGVAEKAGRIDVHRVDLVGETDGERAALRLRPRREARALRPSPRQCRPACPGALRGGSVLNVMFVLPVCWPLADVLFRLAPNSCCRSVVVSNRVVRSTTCGSASPRSKRRIFSAISATAVCAWVGAATCGDSRILGCVQSGSLVRQRLGAEHIERRAAELAAIERGDQIGIDDMAAACAVDEEAARRQRAEHVRVDAGSAVSAVSGSRLTRMSAPRDRLDAAARARQSSSRRRPRGPSGSRRACRSRSARNAPATGAPSAPAPSTVTMRSRASFSALRRPFALGLQLAIERRLRCQASACASTQSPCRSASPSSTRRTIGRCIGHLAARQQMLDAGIEAQHQFEPGHGRDDARRRPADDDIGHRRIAGLGLLRSAPHGPAAPAGTCSASCFGIAA